MNIIKKVFGCNKPKGEVSSLTDYHVLKGHEYLCDKCEFWNKDCKKLHFANTTICVCKKGDFAKFNVKPSRKAKK